jgi:hypothetical protein
MSKPTNIDQEDRCVSLHGEGLKIHKRGVRKSNMWVRKRMMLLE